jgi:uncharacterized protein (DUF433 family)
MDPMAQPEYLTMTNPTSALDTEIISDPAIHRGEPIIAGTSTPVRAVAELWNQGMAAEEIPLHLSHLKLQQVFAALYYYLSHRQQIDQYIAANHIPNEWVGRRLDSATGQVQ